MKDSNLPLLLINGDNDDMDPINGVRSFLENFITESIKLWYLAGPAILCLVCQFSLGAITQVCAGHVGTIELAAVTVENSVIAGFGYGIMMGMGSAFETLCGQAYGARQFDMLGTYMQRLWIILLATSLPLVILYIFAMPILQFIGQTPDISRWAGIFSILMIPQLFAYAMNFPIQKFLQAQSKILVMAVISSIVMCVHGLLSWFLMLKLEWGLVGGAVALNTSWWLIVIAQLVYIFSGRCGEAWCGFSIKAFENLWGFVRLSLSSAVMLCLQFWYGMVLILMAGYLKNAEVGVSGLSICMNIFGITDMIASGFSAAISVRVSNELGTGHPRIAKFSVIVVITTSLILGSFLGILLLLLRHQYPILFSNSKEVQQVVYELTPLLSALMIIGSVQSTFTGVAVGAGWQFYMAYVNIVCYYVFGIPLALTLTFVFDMGVKGILYGMLAGLTTQTCVLLWMAISTNWIKEASVAGERIKRWGGKIIEDEHTVN